MSEWRPIFTYDPATHPTVIIAGKYPNGLWFVEESCWRKDINCFAGRQLDRVTHWMPLPEPPCDPGDAEAQEGG